MFFEDKYEIFERCLWYWWFDGLFMLEWIDVKVNDFICVSSFFNLLLGI